MGGLIGSEDWKEEIGFKVGLIEKKPNFVTKI